MICYVYKSSRKQDHYLYLSDVLEEISPNPVPEALLNMLGELTFVLDFELTESRQLPQANAKQVLSDIASKGFYLQMPKQDMQALEDELFN